MGAESGRVVAVAGMRAQVARGPGTADPAPGERHDDLCGMREEDPGELRERLRGIAAVLTIIGETPNARFNAEGMAAIRGEVENAALIEREAKPILDVVDPTDW